MVPSDGAYLVWQRNFGSWARLLNRIGWKVGEALDIDCDYRQIRCRRLASTTTGLPGPIDNVNLRSTMWFPGQISEPMQQNINIISFRVGNT